MKIGINYHTHDDYVSGVDYYTLGLVGGLLSIDDVNEYVIYTNWPQLFENYINVFQNIRIHAVDGLKSRIKRICWEHFMLPWIAKEDKLDLLHCPGYITPWINVGIPYVVTIHDTFALDSPRWCKWSNRFNYGFFMPKASFKADAILTVSKQSGQKLLKHGQSIDPIVIYPGIDGIFIPDGNDTEERKIKKKYHLPDRYLLYVGNIEPKKNLMTLLKAYQVLKAKKMPHKLVLVGKRTWRQNDVWKYIQDNFSADEIVLTGYADRQHLPGIYRQAEVFVFPSLDEGFGFPALEAMRCGVPVVAASVGILREFPEKAYCKVNPNDAMDIAAKICSIIRDSVLKASQIELAHNESRRFSWQQCAQETLKIYQQVAV